MLDDDTGGGVKAFDAFPGGVGIGNVVVRKFLALQLNASHQRSWRGVQIAVERRLLVRVFSVA